jgi:hypothetical protein
MRRPALSAALFAALLLGIAAAPARASDDRALALDYLGQGTAAFRMGDIVAATRYWSDAIRL